MNPQAGTLGKYQIIREIARSNDIVYEAYDPRMNRRVALKELSMPGGASDKQRQERLARFQREAKAAGSLSHPNIVTIYEVGEDAGRAYIAMEYLEGQNLRQKLDVVGSLPQAEAVNVIVEVLKALQYAHEHGIVHRDIKPDNIQLLPDGRVKITDFGIARLMFEPNLTMDGQIFGTPSYMSPEQVVGREIDARTDIWGCGVVLFEAIAGQKPFAGDSVVSISHAILHRDPNDVPHADYSVAQVVMKAVSKAPDMRYPTATAMQDALKEAIASPQPYAPTQPAVYANAQPFQIGGPLDPYAPGGAYHGQPYGQPYGTGQPNMPPIQLPPGWASAPPRVPLLSPATALFLRRTAMVIVVGATIIGLGVYGIATLTGAGERIENSKYEQQQAVRIMMEAAEFRNQAIEAPSTIVRLQLIESAAARADEAMALSNNETLARDAALIYLDLAVEYRENSSLSEAATAATNAAKYAALSKSPELQKRAAELLNDLANR